MVKEHQSTQPLKVLIIEDEADIRRFLRATLLGTGYRVLESATGDDGLQKVADEKPAVVLLDLGLPDMDGLSVIRKLRGWSSVPIIVLSARGNETDKIKALDGGADDYLTKPFGVGELLARIRVALRRLPDVEAETADVPFVLGDLRVDFARRQVFLGETEVHLTPIEHRLLTALIRHGGKLVTHRQLLKEVWGPESVYETHYLRVYMAHLRRKIETDPVATKVPVDRTGHRLSARVGLMLMQPLRRVASYVSYSGPIVQPERHDRLGAPHQVSTRWRSIARTTAIADAARPAKMLHLASLPWKRYPPGQMPLPAACQSTKTPQDDQFELNYSIQGW